MNELYKKSHECINNLRTDVQRKLVLSVDEWNDFNLWANDPSKSRDTLEELCALLLCTAPAPIDVSESIRILLEFSREWYRDQCPWTPFLLGAAQIHVINFYQKQNKRIPFSFIKTLGTIWHNGNWETKTSVLEFLEMMGSQALILRPEIEKINCSWTFPWQRDKRRVQHQVNRWLKKWKIPKGK